MLASDVRNTSWNRTVGDYPGMDDRKQVQIVPGICSHMTLTRVRIVGVRIRSTRIYDGSYNVVSKNERIDKEGGGGINRETAGHGTY